METGTRAGIRIRCLWQNGGRSLGLWGSGGLGGWGQSPRQEAEGRELLQDAAGARQAVGVRVWRRPGPCLRVSANGGLCAYLIVFEKLTLPSNQLEVSWCLRQPGSLPNGSLEKVTKSWQNVRAGRNLRIVLCHRWPTSRWGSFLANQILPRSQVCKNSSFGGSWVGRLGSCPFFFLPFPSPSKEWVCSPAKCGGC